MGERGFDNRIGLGRMPKLFFSRKSILPFKNSPEILSNGHLKKSARLHKEWVLVCIASKKDTALETKWDFAHLFRPRCSFQKMQSKHSCERVPFGGSRVATHSTMNKITKYSWDLAPVYVSILIRKLQSSYSSKGVPFGGLWRCERQLRCHSFYHLNAYSKLQSIRVKGYLEVAHGILVMAHVRRVYTSLVKWGS